MNILVTGFDPFGGESINPAWEAVKRLPTTINGANVHIKEIPTCFHRSAEVLVSAINEVEPGIILCVGQAGGRSGLTLERVGINIDDARIPDNDGAQPIDMAIVPGGPNAYFSNLPIKAMVQASKDAGVPAAVSNTAGTYVCNHILYQTLHWIETHHPSIRGGFLHVPFLPEQVVDRPNMASMSQDLIIKGLTSMLDAATRTLVDIQVTGGAEH